jgi:hypothetical protein
MSLVSLRALVAALLLPLSAAVAAEDTPKTREKEADRYLQAVSPQTLIGEMTKKVALTLPAAQQEQFKELMTKHLDMNHVVTLMRASLVKTFTTEEIHALADFYNSPVGKSAMAKMPAYMSEVMPPLILELQTAAAKAQTGE